MRTREDPPLPTQELAGDRARSRRDVVRRALGYDLPLAAIARREVHASSAPVGVPRDTRAMAYDDELAKRIRGAVRVNAA
jgi:hypothetical protein